MPNGTVVSIHIGPEAEKPLITVESVRAVPGRGLEGDRYFAGSGFYSDKAGPHREATLIECEALEALENDYGVKLAPGESRRNIVTRGVALNHLVGKEFRVGAVTLRGVKLCEPCNHLASLTQEQAKAGLVHRGGLRCQIVTEGVIRAGDPVTEA